jgi:hypothetical protein
MLKSRRPAPAEERPGLLPEHNAWRVSGSCKLTCSRVQLPCLARRTL